MVTHRTDRFIRTLDGDFDLDDDCRYSRVFNDYIDGSSTDERRSAFYSLVGNLEDDFASGVHTPDDFRDSDPVFVRATLAAIDAAEAAVDAHAARLATIDTELVSVNARLRDLRGPPRSGALARRTRLINERAALTGGA